MIKKMNTYKIDGRKYYLVSEIMCHHRIFFQEYKNEIEFVLENNVPDDKYTFASETNKKSNKIYILKKWFDDKKFADITRIIHSDDNKKIASDDVETIGFLSKMDALPGDIIVKICDTLCNNDKFNYLLTSKKNSNYIRYVFFNDDVDINKIIN